CRILLVDNTLFLLEATAIDRAAAVFIPLHVVVSGKETCTLIHVPGRQPVQLTSLSIGARTALAGLQNQLLRAVGEIGDRWQGDATDQGESRIQEIDIVR